MSECTCDTFVSCTRVVLDLYAAIDAGKARSAVALFADDAVFETTKQRSEGLEAVASFLAAREDDTEKRTLHVLTNLRHDTKSNATVELDALLLVYGPGREETSPPWVLEHALSTRHVLRRANERWLIQERVPG